MIRKQLGFPNSSFPQYKGVIVRLDLYIQPSSRCMNESKADCFFTLEFETHGSKPYIYIVDYRLADYTYTLQRQVRFEYTLLSSNREAGIESTYLRHSRHKLDRAEERTRRFSWRTGKRIGAGKVESGLVTIPHQSMRPNAAHYSRGKMELLQLSASYKYTYGVQSNRVS